MKRMIALVLTLCCVLTCLPLRARAAGEKKLIALTLDDGPASYTSRLLDGLRERNVKVTFFVLGQRVEMFPKTLKRAFLEGHQIAQHTYDHPTLTTQSDAQIAWQLNTTDRLINEALGMEFDYLLRNPYGDSNARVLSLIGRPSIVWSVDSVDWQSRNSYKVRDKIVREAFDGAIVLAHDIHATTIDGVLWAIDILKDRGYEFVTVSELFRRRGVELQDGKLYYSCKPTGTDLGPVLTPTVKVEEIYGGSSVRLETASPGAKIYYSLDGSFPQTLYTEPLPLTGGMQLRACAAYSLNGARSPELLQELRGKKAPLPFLTSGDGVFEFREPEPGTELRMTVDGTEPTGMSALYREPIAWFDGTVRCRAMGMGISSDTAVFHVTKNGNIFRDVPPAAWFFRPVDDAVTQGLFAGVGDYYFRPNRELSRAMLVEVLYRMWKGLGLPEAGGTEPGFRDIPENAYYEEALSWAVEQEIAAGYEDNSFRPDRWVSRQEMCVFLDRFLRAAEKLLIPAPEDPPAETGETVPPVPDGENPGAPGEGETEPQPVLPYEDGEAVAPWALEGVARMTELGIVKGMEDNTFRPEHVATRAQGCVVALAVCGLFAPAPIQ